MIINQWFICYYIKGWNPQGFFGGVLPLIDVGTATFGGGSSCGMSFVNLKR